jgi:hypothetical protein
LELRAKGYSVVETATEAKISTWKARQILDRINSEAREGLLSSMISDRVPLALEQSLELNRLIIRKALSIAEATKDPRCQLEALRLAKDTNQASNQILADSAIIAKAVQRSAITVSMPKQKSLSDSTTNTPYDNREGVGSPVNGTEELYKESPK